VYKESAFSDAAMNAPVARGEGGREDLIQKGLEFLQADGVRRHPMSERVAQLENKGLSQNEVYETLHRLHAASSGAGASSVGSQLLPALGGGSWLWNALIGVAMVGVGYLAYEVSTGEEEFPDTEPAAELSALAVSSGENQPPGASAIIQGTADTTSYLTDRAYAPLEALLPTSEEEGNVTTYMLDGEDEGEGEGRGESGEAAGEGQGTYSGGRNRNSVLVPGSALGAAAATLGGGGGGFPLNSDIPGRIHKNIVDLRAAVDAAVEAMSSKQEPAWAAAQVEQQKEMARNIRIIKANLDVMDFGEEGGASAALSCKKMTDFYQPDPSRKRGKKAYMRCVRKMKADIQDMAASNGTSTASAFANGCRTIIMYLNNIISNPAVPRYHRISTSNQTFKGTLGPLAGHEQVLLGAGFVRSGAYFEWIGANANVNGVGGATRAETGGDTLPATLPAAAGGAANGGVANDSTPASPFDGVSTDERVALLKECVRLLVKYQGDKTSN